MKCKMCGKKTDWDSSYGRPNFIICPVCHKKMTNLIEKLRYENCSSETITTALILDIGYEREKEKE